MSGSNPKDWKVPEWRGTTQNQGDDIAGVVHEIGENVFEFKPGDRVAAFHEMVTPGGSYAEYALAWQYTTFHIPKQTTFEGELLTTTWERKHPVPSTLINELHVHPYIYIPTFLTNAIQRRLPSHWRP